MIDIKGILTEKKKYFQHENSFFCYSALKHLLSKPAKAKQWKVLLLKQLTPRATFTYKLDSLSALGLV